MNSQEKLFTKINTNPNEVLIIILDKSNIYNKY